MLRKIRIILASLFFVSLTLLFLDFTGTAHAWLGWMAELQLLPAVLALNVGIVLLLVVLTLLFGRVYCSVICPLGVMQDIAGWLGRKRKKNRYCYSKPLTWLRGGVLVAFVAAMLAGFASLAALIAPYSAFGRMVSTLLQPLWMWGNNGLAYLAERADSYAFYSVEVWMRSSVTLAVAAVTFVVITVLAWRNGRTWCNTVCPVGTVLGYLAKFSWLKPVINTDKCIDCGLCGKNCKAACIDTKAHKIDYTRCVACMDCLNKCSKGAISYVHPTAKKKEETNVDASRRSFLTATAVLTATAALKAQEKTVDGGLAAIEDKIKPERATHITPPGSQSIRHFAQHCTACQLCVSACPNEVLRPSSSLETFMQPELSYERGYCRPECTRCADVCPTNAILPIDRAEKSATQIGHAVWVKTNCLPMTEGVSCNNCATHCPTGAVKIIPLNPDEEKSVKIPLIDTERCIGCGACENLCPARPFSAIYVEGHEQHRTI